VSKTSSWRPTGCEAPDHAYQHSQCENGDETFWGCRGSEKDVFFCLNKYSRNVD